MTEVYWKFFYREIKSLENQFKFYTDEYPLCGLTLMIAKEKPPFNIKKYRLILQNKTHHCHITLQQMFTFTSDGNCFQSSKFGIICTPLAPFLNFINKTPPTQ